MAQEDAVFGDFLLDMDFDELIPVDNFFDSYVGALSKDQSAAALPDTVGIPPPAPTGQSVKLEGVFSDAVPGPGQPMPAALAGNGFPPFPSITSAQPPVNGLQPPAALDAVAETAGNIGQVAGGVNGMVGAGGFDQAMAMHDVAETSTSVDHAARAPGMRKRGQTKTERQQMLNKAAQQRYRERKKAKAQELKNAVSSLQEKVQELSMVHAEKDALQGRVSELEKDLAMKEAKLASMQQQETTSHHDTAACAFGDDAVESNITEFMSQFADEVSKLRAWLARHGLSSADGQNVKVPLEASQLSEPQLVEMKEHGERCYSSCLRCLSMFTDVDVAGLIDSSTSDSATRFQGGEQQWLDLVGLLQLDASVKEHALQLRQKYMAKLQMIFNERQALNLEAVKVLLPQEVGGMAATKNFGKAPDFFTRYRHAFDTASVLRRLRGNLAEEQKALAELDYLVYIKLLNPVQLARCILTAFPQHCDVVSLLNAVNAL